MKKMLMAALVLAVGPASAQVSTLDTLKALAPSGAEIAVPDIPPSRPVESESISVTGAEDAALLTDGLKEIFPMLPPDQQELIRNGLQFVVTSNEPDTSLFWAWGPEDDTEYRYPDRTFYPQGTIKINVTLVAVDVLRLKKRVPEHVREVLKSMFYAVIVHEVEHARQYMTQPVLALSMDKHANECPDGLCDEKRMEGTRLKVQYELDALERERRDAKGSTPAEYRKAAEFLEQHPELLFVRKKNLSKSLRNEAELLEIGVTEHDRTFYESEYVLPKLAREYAALRAAGAADGPRGREIVSEFERYFAYNCKDHADILTDNAPYLIPVFKSVLGQSKCQ